MFSSTQYFTQHLYANGNGGCEFAFFRRKQADRDDDTRPSVRTRAQQGCRMANRRRTIAEVEAVLERNGAAKRRMDTTPTDFSVFEWQDDEPVDSEPPVDTLNIESTDPQDNVNIPSSSARVKEDDGMGYLNADRTRMNEFYAYCERAKKDYKSFGAPMKAAVELMNMMNTKGGSLALYVAIFDWHIANLNAQSTVPVAKLHNALIERYNMEGTMPKEVPVKLPHAGETVNISTHNCLAQTTDLLTDPRWGDEDFLFFNDDPQSGPPDNWDVLKDVDTGRAMRESYKSMVGDNPYTATGRRKVPVGFIMYVDACVTGQYQNLNIEIFKFTLSLLNNEAREKDYGWRNLGYVPNRVKGKGKAEELLRAAKHIDAKKYLEDPRYRAFMAPQSEEHTPNFGGHGGIVDEEDDGNPPDMPEVKAQDLHVMLDAILSSYGVIEDTGLEWDKLYHNKVHRLLLLPFILFLKVDGVEADKVTGQYLTKSGNVSSLCRSCVCPTDQSDEPYRTYQRKSQSLIQKLVANGDTTRLKQISQQHIWNAFYQFRFGSHNDHGIHGACPMEALHWICINSFGYTRSNFFEQCGPTSGLAETINTTAIAMGTLLKRQSDRDMPRTQFTKSVQEGKVMAHEMAGVLLVLLMTIRSTRGRQALLTETRGRSKLLFPDKTYVRDWIALLETQLQFERWMNLPEIRVNLVHRAGTKFREMMNMNRRIAKRESGMGFRTLNFHGTLHVPEDMLNFGVPTNVNTRSNEMHHKRDKKTAARTSKQLGKFDIQMARKVTERLAIDFGMEELNGRPRWKYYSGFDHSDRFVNSLESEPFAPSYTGVQSVFFKRPGKDRILQRVCTSMKGKENFKYGADDLLALHEVFGWASDYLQSMTVYTECKLYDTRAENNRQTYRASPYFQGHPQHDWGMFDLSTEHNPEWRDYVACQIKCFVDLSELPEENDLSTSFGDVVPGMYAIIEPAWRNPDGEEQGLSDLLDPWIKKEEINANLAGSPCVTQLVEMSRLLSPAVLVPDLDNTNPRAYLRVVPRAQWPYMFEDWLEAPHTRDFDEPQGT